MDNSKIRLHVPAIPYTITRDEFSHDAYTGKVKRFAPMMRSRGFEVFHYGVETSESGANQHFDLLTKEEWRKLRIETVKFVDPKLTHEEAVKRNDDPEMVISVLSNWSSPLTKEFNRRFRQKLLENYRSKQTDIVCIPLGRTYEDALRGLDVVKLENGIGYSGSYFDFRIFESYAWMSRTLGAENKQPQNYWFVVPNYFDTEEFKFSANPKPLKVGYLGRVTELKGCNIIKEVAKRFPHVEFVMCGQGEWNRFIDPEVPNLKYKSPIHGSERSDFLGECVAFIHPVKYLEPFGGGAVEAQLCGTPVICADWGALPETIEPYKTGLHCHTLADYCHGIQMALDGKFDRKYIRERAVKLYDMYNIAYKYEYVYKSILDVYTPSKNGWYSPDSHIKTLVDSNSEIKPKIKKENHQRIYLFIPYYGELSNYFQLYLDSLEINKDILTVFFITDLDLSSYKLPENLIHVKMNIGEIRNRITNVIYKTYGKHVSSDEVLKDYYKFVDFKIIYPIMFDDLIKNYNISTNDYVGWGDCDLIYGKLSNFIDFNENYGIIGGWHGHFTAILNNNSFKYNFRTIHNYLDLILDNSKTFITDEIAYREPLKKYLADNKIKMFYINKYFCDIVPPCFYHMSRPNYKDYSNNFYDLYNPTKSINHVYFDKENSKLTVVYDDKTSRETIYAHLQKRKMQSDVQSYTKGFYINENSFTLEKPSSNLEPIVEVKSNKKITVIAYCSGYDYDTFERFTKSLYQTGFTGELIFIINEKDLPILEKLMENYKNVSGALDQLINPRQCQQKRYYLYQKLLNTVDSDYVLLTDCRDVFFQKNIEEYVVDSSVEIYFAGEGNTLGNCKFNQKWLNMMEEELGTEIISKIQDKPIICSGTTFGTLQGIKKYVDQMCHCMTNVIKIDYPGLDQGVHNYLIHLNLLTDLKYEILPSDNLLFNTLQYGYKFMNSSNQLINIHNEVSYIVHQWDRLPSYMKERLFKS